MIERLGKSNVSSSVDGGSSPSSDLVCCLVQVPSLPQASHALGEMRAGILPVSLMLSFYNEQTEVWRAGTIYARSQSE